MNVAVLLIAILPEIHLIVILIGCSFDCRTTWHYHMVKHVANAFQSLILSDSVERSIQFFLSFSWDPTKSEINEAAESITSVNQTINLSLNDSFNKKV